MISHHRTETNSCMRKCPDLLLPISNFREQLKIFKELPEKRQVCQKFFVSLPHDTGFLNLQTIPVSKATVSWISKANIGWYVVLEMFKYDLEFTRLKAALRSELRGILSLITARRCCGVVV